MHVYFSNFEFRILGLLGGCDTGRANTVPLPETRHPNPPSLPLSYMHLCGLSVGYNPEAEGEPPRCCLALEEGFWKVGFHSFWK